MCNSQSALQMAPFITCAEFSIKLPVAIVATLGMEIIGIMVLIP